MRFALLSRSWSSVLSPSWNLTTSLLKETFTWLTCPKRTFLTIQVTLVTLTALRLPLHSLITSMRKICQTRRFPSMLISKSVTLPGESMTLKAITGTKLYLGHMIARLKSSMLWRRSHLRTAISFTLKANEKAKYKNSSINSSVLTALKSLVLKAISILLMPSCLS